MTSREAYAVLAALVAEYGTTEGVQRAADLAGVGWHTAYGWWRRRSVPAWRANAFERKAAA